MSPPSPTDPQSVAPDAHARAGERHRTPAGSEGLARELAERSPSRLATALRIIESVMHEATLPAALHALVAGIHGALAADTVVILLLEESEAGPALAVAASYGSVTDSNPGHRIPVGRGLIGRIAERRETVIVRDLRELAEEHGLLAHDRAASVLGVPVSDQDRLVGVLYAAARTVRRFSDEDRQLTELVAVSAGPAIGRARLADALQLYRTQLEAQTGELESTASELELTVQALRRANAELAATAEAARAAQFAAEAANRAKSSFLATMSHELRTPLNAILGYASLLLDGLAGPLLPAQRDFIERARTSGRHLLGLIEEVLDIAKVESGQMYVDIAPVSASRVTSAAVALVRPQASNAGVSVDAAGCADVLAELAGDERRVRQVVLNLLANAVKFTRRGGTVSVECERRTGPAPFAGGRGDEWVCIRISDTGIGIEPDNLETIFEPFVQLDTSHTRARGGTGLGLAISRRFARLMGGDITVSSHIGQGTVFTLWLPAWTRDHRVAPAGTAPDDSAVSHAPGASGRPAGTRAGRVALGELLVANASSIVASVADRLRSDPELTRTRQISRTELEDHVGAYLSDIGQLFAILDEQSGTARLALIADGNAIQNLIAKRHGAQRHRLGWTESELRREHAILIAEVERVVLDSVMLTGSPPRDTLPLLRRILEEAEETSVQGYRAAAARAG